MEAARERLVGWLAGGILAALAGWGVRETTPELASEVHRWVGHTLEVAVMIGTAALHARLRRRTGGSAMPAAAGGPLPRPATFTRLVIRWERGRRR